MGEKTCFMKYNFEESIISKVSSAGRSEGADLIPLEEVEVRYGVIKWEYTPTEAKGGGKTGAAIKANWCTLTNKSV
jgi:type VI secretion system secreted protein Hcp